MAKGIFGRKFIATWISAFLALVVSTVTASATPFTTTVPGTGVVLPDDYPEAGGVAIVLTGVNGNIYYQFSDPTGAFVGYQNTGAPVAFRGNPFTINDPIPLDCGFRSCTDYFGGSIARIDVRFSAYDGDTQPGGFDENDITLVMNGFDIGNWSGRTTDRTNDSGTTSFGLTTGFGNNTFNTGWFSSTNASLLNNILTSGVTTTQVRDDDPNDNYWDFTRGDSLPDEELRTVAPGYELEKTRRDAGDPFGVSGSSTFAAVGEVITYDFVVRNIGSVDINNVSVVDDKIGAVTCSPTTINKTASGGTAEEAQCTGTYTVTQADVDAGEITNIAEASGDPEFGELGTLTDQVTLTKPTSNPSIDFEKTVSPSTFTAAGQTLTFTLRAINDGDVTLSNVVVTDPMFPGLSCTFASIAPLSSENSDNDEECTVTYVTTQADVDNAASGTQIENTATARGTDPDGSTINVTDTAIATGPTAAPAMSAVKTADVSSFSAVGDVINYEIVVTNTGNVTWTSAVTIDDPLTSDEVCPNVTVAPGDSVTCTASYTVTQTDLDNEEIVNDVDVSITQNGVTANDSAQATVPADVMPLLTIEKSLSSGPDPFTDTADELVYSYVLKNEGNVVLDNIVLTDDKVSLTCPTDTIPAGGQITCTSDPYQIQQEDIDAGFVTNTASATSETGAGGPVPTATDDLTVNADQSPALGLEKSAAPIDPQDFVANSTVDYSYVVTNTGNVTLSGPFEVSDDKFTTPIACPPGPLAPNGTLTCTASYTVTSADVANGFVTNVATVSDGTTTSPSDSVSVPQGGAPSISLVKEATDASFNPAAVTYDETSDTLYYRFAVTNDGNTTIDGTSQPITIDDPAFTASGDSIDCSAQPANLAPGATFYCTGSFSGLDQDDLDNGSFTNVASASFLSGGVPVTSNQATETVSADIARALTLSKTVLGSAQFSAVNDPVTFVFRVTNDSPQTIASATVTDPLIPALSCTLTDIPPSPGFKECTGTYFITQADMDAGTVTNEATATGQSPTGAMIPADTDTATITLDPVSANPSFIFDKQASTATYAAVGDTIDYTFVVTNNGNLTLNNVTVSDTPLGFTCTVPTLVPGATNSSCTASKTITQADVDAGSFTNNASASGGGAPTQTDSETATGPAAAPAMTFTKTATSSFSQVGDIVRYSFDVENTGNVTLTNVVVSDTTAVLAPTTFSCTIPSIAPNTTDSSCFFDYTVRQADIDRGAIDNTANVAADTPSSGQITDSASATSTGPAEVIDLVVAKAEQAPADGEFGAEGTSEGYTLSVTNNSNVTLTGLTIDDPLIGLSCSLDDLAPGASTTTCAGGSPALTGSYTIQQADVDRGSLTNTATAEGTTDRGTTANGTDSLTLDGPPQLPSLSLAKSSPTADYAAVGDTVDYSYVVTNDGNITITSPITVDDDKTTVTCPALPASGLAPSASITCTASYVVDQDDLDDGSVTNIATASASQSVVPSATYPTGVAEITSPSATETVNANQQPELSLAKDIKPGTSSTYDDVSDVITFEFVVTNSGNVTTTAPITITDTDLGLTNFACGPAGIAPGDSVTCEATWSPDQDDINNGSFTNTATASTVFNGATETSAPDTATASAIQIPELTTQKVVDSSSPIVFASGETVTYFYNVSNTGNETIFGPITVNDNLIPSTTCPAGDLLPGASMQCSGTYTLMFGDIELGSVTNIATASGATADGEVIVSDPSAVTVPTNVDPAIEITKIADVSTFNKVGDQITYTYTVTNTSSGDPNSVPQVAPSLVRDIFINDDKLSGPLLCYESTAANQELIPGETVTCATQGVYTVTQEDLDALDGTGGSAFVTNNASGDTTYPGAGAVVSDPVQVTVDGEALPSLDVSKSVIAGNDPANAGDVLTFEIEVLNDGNQTMSGVLVTDPLIPSLSCEVGGTVETQPLTLAPTEIAVCTGPYTVTQDDVDAQSLSNTASANGTNPDGTPVSETGTTTHPLVTQTPSVTIEKTLKDGSLSTAFTDVGQEITFAIAVENTGNVTLVDVEVTDILFPGDTCAIGSLAPGERDETTCEFTYAITQEDIDRGDLTNEASVTAEADTPAATPVSDDDSVTGTGPAREPEISLVKTADVVDFDAEGDLIPYTFTVANIGNVTITETPSISDDKIDTVTCDPIPAAGLAPNDFITCTGTYEVVQTDVDAGALTNTATATVADPLNPAATLSATSSDTINSIRSPALDVTKVASDDTEVAEGETITYTYTVTNTGNVTLTNVTLDDQHTSEAGTSALTISNNPIASIAPGASVQRTATYVVTQADVDAQIDLTNTVTVNATAPTGATDPTPATASEVVDLEDRNPSMEVIKTVTAPSVFEAGEVVTYTVTVENDGNQTLDNVVITDTLTRNDGTVVNPAPTAQYTSGDAGVVGDLEVDEVWTYTLTHTLTQADIDAGGLSNSARATATDPTGAPVSDISDTGTGNGSTPTPLIIPASPAIEGEKTITSTGVGLGDIVRFEITATNTGNVTLNSVSVASDTLRRADGTALSLTSAPSFVSATMGSGAGTLQVDETATYRATYILTQEDIDAGGISNIAVVEGSPPVGGPVQDTTDDGDDSDGNSSDDPTVLDITAAPALELAKDLTDGGPTFDAVGDVLEYTFTVTNTGNVTITDAVTINDPMITDAGGTITCEPVPLEPLASLECVGSYEVTQDDIDNNEVVNTATAQSGTTTSDPATETVPALQLPALETVKTAVAITTGGTTYTTLESQYFVTGAVIDYEYTVTNTGNQTLTDAITVDDNLTTTSCPALPATGLAPNAQVVCTGQYTVTADDVSNTSVTNLADATSGNTTSPLVSETVPAQGEPLLTVVKDLTAVTNPDNSASSALTFDEVGDVLTYTFTITNDGTVAFAEDVLLYDDKVSTSPITCFTSTTGDPDFIPGESLTCTGDYTVTQDDLDAGEVFNQAYAETMSGPGGTPVVSAPATQTTPADDMPMIEITKSAATLPITGVGQVLTYTLTIENTGNQTLTSIEATDPLLPMLSCEIAELAPLASATCSDTYEVAQDDIDNGELVNTASVTGITPSGGSVEDDTSLTLAVPAAAPALTLAKSASPDPFGAVGSSVTYTFEVANTGNVTLFDVVVTDPDLDPAYSCTVARLDVGATDNFCTYSYTVTQDDKDAGEIVNTANAEGEDPFGTTTSATDTITTPSEPAMPGIEATKTASVGGTFVGAPVTYTLTLVNTGDVTLTIANITDTMTRRGNNSATALDAPFAFLSGDDDNDGRLDVDEVWTYRATYTLTQVDIDQGGMDNSVEVRATDPFGTQVTDISDDGNDADGNSTDDPTEVEIVPGPAINAVKTVATGGSTAGDVVVFAIDVTNVGNVSLTDVGVVDTLRRADGTPLTADDPAVQISPASPPASLAPGDTWGFEYSYTLQQDDVDAGGLVNTATATGTPPFGAPVTDVSDDGDDTDGNTLDDETTLTIAPDPGLNVTKTALPLVQDPAFAGDVVTFEVLVENTGNVTLTDLVITDTLTNNDGTVLTPDSITLVSGEDETYVGAGLSNTFEVAYTLTQEDVDSGGITNTVTADALTPNGVTLTDVSDDGDDADGNVLDDPTEVTWIQDNTLVLTKSGSIPTRIVGSEFRIVFDMTVENTGNTTRRDMAISDDLAAFAAPATLVSTTVPAIEGFDEGVANASFNGTSDTTLVSTPNALAPGETGTIQITVIYDVATGAPAQPNVMLVDGDTATANFDNTQGAGGSPEPDLFASKSVTPDNALRGATVTYVLQFENRLEAAESGLTLVDDLPAGVSVDIGTATYNGNPSPVPELNGRRMTWSDVSILPNETVTISFDARITGSATEIVNRAYIRDANGAVVSNVAEAVLTRRPEAVFDCGEVIGKVFDDRNLNGYQDGAPAENRALVTDQTYDGNKAVATPEAEHEPGIANARLATVDGTIITTDEYGRFSVPCAALPADIGSNFTLKLDERSLPTGYQVTTENPRVVRLTPGTIAKMNFGAAIATVIDIDLMDAAFASGTEPTQALIAGVAQLAERMQDEPTVLNLSYYRNGEGRDLARARLDRVEQMVRDAWRGRDNLVIDRSIQRLQ